MSPLYVSFWGSWMGIWFLAYLTTPFQKGHVRIRVFDFNMKAQRHFFLKIWPHGWQENLLMSWWILSLCCLSFNFSWKHFPQIKHWNAFTLFYWGSDNVDVNEICFWTLCNIWNNQMVFQVFNVSFCDEISW